MSIATKYSYQHLEVTCLEVRKFRLDQMREAVEYLKLQPQTGFTGLTAVAHEYRSPKSGFLLGAKPMLQLSEILGKTPREVWTAFDDAIDAQVRSLDARSSSGFKP